MATKLEQTKGQFKLAGKVKGISNENALREGTTKNDKPYKSLSFFVETSPVNAIKVELFAMERDHVFAYSSKAKETKKIDWSERLDNHGDYKVIGVSMGLEKGSDGKNIRKMMVEWDAIEYIVEHLQEGDSVFVAGEIDYQQYQDQEGNLKEAKRFVIKSISRTKKDIDFDAEDFKEMSQFEQEIVVTGAEIDKTDKDNPKLFVTAKIIKYNGEASDTMFVVDAKKYPKLANNMKKRFKFGDFIKVYGLCIDKFERIEAEEVVVEDEWGGDTEINKSFNNNYIKNRIQELQIISVDSTSYSPKKYKEEYFFSEDEDNFGEDFDEEDILGDDFSDDEEDTGFEEEDDLPFK